MFPVSCYFLSFYLNVHLSTLFSHTLNLRLILDNTLLVLIQHVAVVVFYSFVCFKLQIDSDKIGNVMVATFSEFNFLSASSLMQL
jgi:hypothetical protein